MTGIISSRYHETKCVTFQTNYVSLGSRRRKGLKKIMYRITLPLPFLVSGFYTVRSKQNTAGRLRTNFFLFLSLYFYDERDFTKEDQAEYI